jgi:hypothetical protein
MDTETSEVIERINARIDALEVSLRAEIRGESAAVRSDLRGEMSTMRDDLRGEMSSIHDELRTEIRDSLAESKRHAVMLNEDVRDDIRMLAEAIATRSTRPDANQ